MGDAAAADIVAETAEDNGSPSSLNFAPGLAYLNALMQQQQAVKREFASNLTQFLGGSNLPTKGGATLPKSGPTPPKKGPTLPEHGRNKYYTTGLKKKIDQLTKPPGTEAP